MQTLPTQEQPLPVAATNQRKETRMSDPQPARLKPRPKRAEPLQPDKPASGTGTVSTTDPAAQKLAEAAADKKQLEQVKTAHENTRDGYG